MNLLFGKQIEIRIFAAEKKYFCRTISPLKMFDCSVHFKLFSSVLLSNFVPCDSDIWRFTSRCFAHIRVDEKYLTTTFIVHKAPSKPVDIKAERKKRQQNDSRSDPDNQSPRRFSNLGKYHTGSDQHAHNSNCLERYKGQKNA